MPSETINSLSPDFRDVLLNKNLKPFTDNTSANGLGLPTSIQLNQPLASSDVTTIDDNANAYRDLNIIINPYQKNQESNKIGESPLLIGNSNTEFTNGQYEIPDNFEESPLNDEISSYPYGGAKPISFLTRKNLYSDNDLMIDAGQSMYDIFHISEQIPTYLDEKGRVRGLPPQTASNVIGTLLSGRQLGYSPNGPEPNYDIRSSIVGRVLAPTIGDTPLGLIGAEQLMNAMMSNASVNAQQETIGRVNVTGLFNKNEDFILPNYDITVRDGFLGKALDFWENLSGTQFPSSNIIKDDASIFTSDNPNTNSVDISQNLLSKFTGRGQINSLFGNLNENIYTPPYQDNRILGENKGLNDTRYNSTIFVGLTNAGVSYENISNSLYVEKNTCEEENLGNDNPNNEFTWVKSEESQTTIQTSIPDPFSEITFEGNNLTSNSLLNKTQVLFDNNKIKSLINDDSVKATKDETQSSITKGQLSKGSAVRCNQGDGDLCRTWTTFRRYNKVHNLQKNQGLYQNNGNERANYARHRNNTEGSVLDDNGFVKIGPYDSDMQDPRRVSGLIKKYMFSIENLAWMDNINDLPPCEIGNGDPSVGEGRKRGRIMWFPPYDISFNDNVAVDITSTKFIGRGEPIYTYNNTERTGMLSFKIIMDHPSYINEPTTRQQLNDEYYASIIAGCENPPDLEFTEKSEEQKRNEEISNNISKPSEVNLKPYEPKKYKYYFPNNSSKIQSHYEDGSTGNTQFEQGEYFGKGNPSKDDKDFGLNATGSDYLSSLENGSIYAALKDCPDCKVTIKGYASKAGTVPKDKNKSREEINLKLATDRATEIKEDIIYQLKSEIKDIEQRVKIIKTAGETDVNVGDLGTDNRITKKQRYALIIINKDYVDSVEADEINDETSNELINTETNKESEQKYYNECLYFEKIKHEDPMVFNQFKEKIKFFHPAFHSTTPEGFNSRLTFLHQCTRQGPTKYNENNNENNNDEENNGTCNLAFGRPPVCILRIGDFFNTKIMVSNLTIDYEPLTWDLNPEGVGVQPMIANVTLNFNFMGGSSLQGPINKLQNAVSFNFFANTEVYDGRADSIISEPNVERLDTLEPTNIENETNQGVITNNEERPTDMNSVNNLEQTNNLTNDSNEWNAKMTTYGYLW